MNTVTVHDRESRGHETSIDTFPDTCPLCHHGIHPSAIGGYTCRDHQLETLQIAFVCPRMECQQVFIGYYDEGANGFELAGTAPSRFKPRQFSAHIQDVSADFVTIYNQAGEAEDRKLDQVCGVAYRRAMEYLIKDYLIFTGKDKDAIRAARLGACIDDHVSDPRVKTCAKRATWLGNDETHYVRRWTDRDVTDLKTLIALTLHWIESELLTKEYEAAMPE